MLLLLSGYPLSFGWESWERRGPVISVVPLTFLYTWGTEDISLFFGNVNSKNLTAQAFHSLKKLCPLAYLFLPLEGIAGNPSD